MSSRLSSIRWCFSSSARMTHSLKCWHDSFQPITEVLHCCKQGLYVFALRFRLADVLGACVALALQLLGLDLQRLAPLLEGQVAGGIERESATCEIGSHLVCGLSELFGIDHFFLISASFSRILISRPRGTG